MKASTRRTSTVAHKRSEKAGSLVRVQTRCTGEDWEALYFLRFFFLSFFFFRDQNRVPKLRKRSDTNDSSTTRAKTLVDFRGGSAGSPAGAWHGFKIAAVVVVDDEG